MSGLPIVGVVDGGLTASSYKPAEAWKAPALVKDRAADAKHGNRVTSLIVQGHDWNNKLPLPPERASLTGTTNPVPVTLTIGDDTGTTSVTALIFH